MAWPFRSFIPFHDSTFGGRRQLKELIKDVVDYLPAERILLILEQRFDRDHDITCRVIDEDSMWRTAREMRTLVSSPTLYAWTMTGVYRAFSYVFALEVTVDDGMWRPTIEKKTLLSSPTLASTNCPCCIIRRDDSWSLSRYRLSPYSRAIDEDSM